MRASGVLHVLNEHWIWHSPMSAYTPYTARSTAPTPHNMVARSSTNRFAEQRSALDRSAVFSFKLKIPMNPERVDVWFREFDDIVFDLRLTERL